MHFAYNKEMRRSCIADIAGRKAWVPGPNKYELGHKVTSPRTIGNYTQRDITSGIIADATAHGMSIPANNAKGTRLKFYKRKAPAIDFKVTKTIRFKPLPKTDLSPTSYKLEGA